MVILVIFLMIQALMLVFHHTYSGFLKDKKNRGSDRHVNFMAKYSNIVNFINLDAHPLNVYFYTIFFARRLTMFTLSVTFFHMFSLQVQFIMFF